MFGLDDKTWNLIGGMALVAVAMGLALAGAKVITYYRRQILEEAEEPLSIEERLAQFRASYQAGEIDEAEFQRIQAALTTEPHSPDVGEQTGAARRQKPTPAPTPSDDPATPTNEPEP